MNKGLSQHVQTVSYWAQNVCLYEVCVVEAGEDVRNSQCHQKIRNKQRNRGVYLTELQRNKANYGHLRPHNPNH